MLFMLKEGWNSLLARFRLRRNALKGATHQGSRNCMARRICAENGTSVAKIAAVIVAAGSGTRAALGPDAPAVPKQFRPVGGQTMLRRTLSLFADENTVDLIQPVIRREDSELYRAAADGIETLPPVFGGATRQDSVRAGLEALAAHAPDIVLIHDAARPFATPALIARAIAAAAETGAAIPALAVTDTVKSVDAQGHVTQTLDRNALRLIQTPQAFAYRPLLDAHRRAAREGRADFTDDAALAEWAGMTVAVFAGETGNIKITHPEDFMRAETSKFAQLNDVRIGNGIDVHAFGAGDHVIIGGIRIAHDRALTGHSDADVGLHALTDAILGALADGDIGSHFPPSDPQWRGASSDRFLKFAVERVTARGGLIAHLDLTIVCEAPKIGPHRDAMRARSPRSPGSTSAGSRSRRRPARSSALPGAAKASPPMRPRRCGCRRMIRECTMKDDMRIAAAAVLDACRARGWQVATAESCTGGLVAGALTEIAGSSDVVDRGFVTYSNLAKHQMLGVPAATLEAHGAVSRETAEAMARGALGASAAHLAVAITGVAGPGGGSPDKPVGLVHFAAASRSGHVDPRRDALWRYRPRRRAAPVGAAGAGDASGLGGTEIAPKLPPIRRYWAKKNKSRGKLYLCCQASQTTSVGRKASSTIVQPLPRRLSKTSMWSLSMSGK